MNKYIVAEKFLSMVSANNKYIDQLPTDLRDAIFDNEYSNNQDALIHQLLELVLNAEELETLYYFAYELNPKIILDEKFEFTSLIEYWKYLDNE